MTSIYGGLFLPPHNLKNGGALDYLIEIIKSEMFGFPVYPSIHEKAAVYLYNINANHIFHDGNKRTGLESAILFLDKNEYVIADAITNQDLIEFTLSVAAGNFTLEEVAQWMRDNIHHKLNEP